jgi:hypothetical protein
MFHLVSSFMSRIIPLLLLLFAGCYPAADPARPHKLGATVNPGATLAPTFTWADRRPIGALHIASPELRSPSNPSGWFHDPALNAADPVALRNRFLAYADGAIGVMREANAQGMIVWQIDGTRYGQFLGCPDIATKINPELTPALAAEFFARFRAAGFLVGVCIRPEEFDEATGQLTPAADPYESLLRKASFARREWKCRLFYVDTNMMAAPGVKPAQYKALIPAAVFARLHKALPDCLWIPEHELVWGVGVNDLGYAQTTVAYQELRGGDLGTPAAVRAACPGAFSVLNISEGDVGANQAALNAAVRAGDILLWNSWWRNGVEMDALKAAYQQ